MAINLITASTIVGKTIAGNFSVSPVDPVLRLPYYKLVIQGSSENTTLKINTFSVFSRRTETDNSSNLAVQCMFNDVALQWNDVYDSQYVYTAGRGIDPADRVQSVTLLTKANFVNKNEPLYLNQPDRLGFQVLGNISFSEVYFSYVVSYEEVSLTV